MHQKYRRNYSSTHYHNSVSQLVYDSSSYYVLDLLAELRALEISKFIFDSVNHFFRIERLTNVDINLTMINSDTRQNFYDSS